MSQAVFLQHRLDALRRKCSTGYGCGSSCISLRKECRASPRSSTSKERLKRLLALAGGGKVPQRGIAPVRGEEAGQLASGIATRRGEKAQQLKGTRQQAATAKAQAAEAAATASTGSKAPVGTPRGEADRAARKKDPDYEFARPSAVGNAGEDIGNSARHKRNAFRTIEEAEASGQVEKVLTRDNLLKNFPTDLISGVTRDSMYSRLVAHFSLKAFPNLSPKDVDSYIKDQERRNATARESFGSLPEGVDAKTVRKQYFDAFQSIRKFIDERKDLDAGELREQVKRKVSELVSDLRGMVGTGYSQTYKDPYNPTANALISMQKRLYQRGPASVSGQVHAFRAALRRNNTPSMDGGLEAATKIMEGSSLAAAFGQQGNGKWRFNSADQYVGHARREGGRRVGGSPEAATDTIVRGLGFRGIQYGNSVTDNERKHHVQKAAEALVDLADATGLPDSAIGLNGTLGLAIGARGRGGAVAHYEPDMKVINLTRKNGVGSLSHEWGHALDNYVGGGTQFLSQNSGSTEKRMAMFEVKSSWAKSGFDQQVRDSIREIKKAGGLITDRYWTSDVEMFARSFEAYVSLKLSKAGKTNTYLTREFDYYGMKKSTASERRMGDGLWPTRRQAEQMEPMFDALLAQIRKDDFSGASNRGDSREERIQRLIREAMPARRAAYPAGKAMDSTMPPNSHAALQARIDAAKKCIAGYSCGASCISMNKICRKSPGAGPAQQKMKRVLALAQPGAATPKPEAKRAAEPAAAGGGGGGSSTEKGGALVRQPQPQEKSRSGASTADEKYAGKADDASVAAYAKEKLKELLNDPKAWENSAFVQKGTNLDNFGQKVVLGNEAEARKAFNTFFEGQYRTRKAELDRGYSFMTDNPKDIEKKLEKAKVSKAKNKEKMVAKLTKELAFAKQEQENARIFVEETYPRMKALSNEEKVAYARDRARKKVDAVIARGMRDLKSEARGGKDVAAVADFLRLEQGSKSKRVAEILGEDAAGDKDVIRAHLTGKGTSEGALGLQPGKQPTRAALKSAYRKAAAKTHPDAGGTPEEFRMTQQAYERLKKKFNYDSLRLRLDALRARCGA